MKKNFSIKNKIYPKTYGRRRGRMKKSKIIKYMKQLDYFKYSANKLNKNQILEIGSGNGENIINLSRLYNHHHIVASEVYIDGNISLIHKLLKYSITNVSIFTENCFFLLENLPKNIINEIWVLYPDPWPKKKHYKRKLINKTFIKLLNHCLKRNGKIYIATDDNNYFIDILSEIYESGLFKWENHFPHLWLNPFDNMAQTTYYKKSLKNGRKSYFMIFSKNI